MNTIRKRLSGVKGGRFARHCAPAQVFSIVLSDILGDPLDMIASGPAYPDSSTCAQALAIAKRYGLRLSEWAWALLAQETPKTHRQCYNADHRQRAGALRGRSRGVRSAGVRADAPDRPALLRGAGGGQFPGPLPAPTPGRGRRLAFIAGGETVVHLNGHGLGGRNQELVLAAAPALDGLHAAVFAVGSDGTDGPTDAAGGYVDGGRWPR